MKKTIISLRQNLTVLLFCSSVLFTSFSSFAAEGDKPVIQFINNDGQSLLLNVKFDNETGTAYTLYVKDDLGNLLYSKKLNEVHLNLNLRLLTDENSESFIIGFESNNHEIAKSYVIRPVIKVISDVIITEQ